MQITLTWQSVVTAAAIIGALVAVVSYLKKLFGWFARQEQQDKEIKSIKSELGLIVYSMRACLDGLEQLGANHTVPDAKSKLDKYINQRAHDQLV